MSNNSSDIVQFLEPRRSVGDHAYAELKQQIIEGALPPGSSWLEEEMAARFGVSRTPVREAMVRLEQEGFITIVPRRGLKVAEFTRRDVFEVNEVLESLELLALQRVAGRALAAEEIARFDAAVAGMDAALAADDVHAWAKADYAFHTTLIDLAGSRHLTRTAGNYLERAHRFRLATLGLRGRPFSSTTSHAATVECIRRQDPATATEIHHLHKRRWAHELDSLLDRLGLPPS